MTRCMSVSISILMILIICGSTPLSRAGEPANDYEPCRADFDGNYAIDLSDHLALSHCMTGPALNNKDIQCVKPDLDRNHHIDLRDLANLDPQSGPCHLCAMKWKPITSNLPNMNEAIDSRSYIIARHI